MKTRRGARVAAAILLVIVAACPLAAGNARRSKRVTLKLEPLGPGSTTTALRLVDAGGAHLVESESGAGPLKLKLSKLVGGAHPGELTATHAATRPLPELAGVPGPPPEWDASTHADGSVSAVWTVAGSAVSHLAFRNTRDPEDVTVNAATPFGVFGAPHFARPSSGVSSAIVAIALIDDQPQVVVFRREKTGMFTRYASVAVAWGGIPVDAKLVNVEGGGSLLLVKVLVPGSVPAGVARRPRGDGESLGAGLVEAVSLDPDLRPNEPATRPLGDQLVFEFDAAPVGAPVAVLATTASGATLALCDRYGRPALATPTPASGKAMPPRAQFEIPSHEPLTSPTLLVQGARLYAAALRAATTPAAQIVAGSLALSAL